MKKIVDIFHNALDLDGFKALSHLADSIVNLFCPEGDNICMCCCCHDGCC